MVVAESYLVERRRGRGGGCRRGEGRRGGLLDDQLAILHLDTDRQPLSAVGGREVGEGGREVGREGGRER